MEAFLDLSVSNGLFLIILGTVIPGILVIFIVRRIIASRIRKQHERVGRLLFRVTASVLALLISLSYANEKMNYDKVVNSLEEEAAIIASVMLKLKVHQTPLAEEIRSGIMEYVHFTIDDGFEDVVNNPYYSKMWATMIRLNIMARELDESTNKKKALKESIILDIDLITKTLQIRFYSTKFSLPYLTYILGLGLIFAWCFFTVYRLDLVSVTFISMYNALLAVLLYFVIMLGNPMTGPLKIDPASFNTLEQMGIDKLPF